MGAGVLVQEKEVALAAAGEAALGTTGLVIVTVGAVFATGSAINATLFATARLARDVAKAGDYPEWVGRTNGRGVPDRAVVVLGTVAALSGSGRKAHGLWVDLRRRFHVAAGG